MIPVLCLVLLPQTFPDEAWFRLGQVPRGADTALVVSGSRPAAPAGEALQRLARLMKWEWTEPAAAVQRRLAPVSVDLSFSGLDPVVAARLIAAAAGVEAVVVRSGRRVRLELGEATGVATGDLRERAIDWYRELLEDSDLSAASRVGVLFRLGQALAGKGDDEAAIRQFQRAAEQDDSGRIADPARFAMARAHDRLSRTATLPDPARRNHRRLAEDRAREILEHGAAELHLPAMLLLGRILVDAGRDEAFLRVFEETPGPGLAHPSTESTSVGLLAAGASLRTGQPEQALRILDALARPIGDRRFTRSQWREYHFLRGTGAAAASRRATGGDRRVLLADAMRSLEWFLGTSPAPDQPGEPVRSPGAGDARRALIALARVYLDLGRYVDARAAALRLPAEGPLAGELLEDARLLEAEVLAALGFREQARQRLELAARAEPEGRAQARLRASREETPAAVPDEPGPGAEALAAGRPEDALAELAGVAADPAASLADLFTLARCHEALHLRDRQDPAKPVKESARHLARAHEIFELIERRDVVRGASGTPAPGPWAVAARGAKATMVEFDRLVGSGSRQRHRGAAR